MTLLLTKKVTAGAVMTKMKGKATCRQQHQFSMKQEPPAALKCSSTNTRQLVIDHWRDVNCLFRDNLCIIKPSLKCSCSLGTSGNKQETQQDKYNQLFKPDAGNLLANTKRLWHSGLHQLQGEMSGS